MRALTGLALATAAVATDIKLVTFDGSQGTTFDFQELNDPVMGGLSTGTWSVDSADHFGIFNGTVVNVPKLQAPGFIKASARGRFANGAAAAGGNLVLEVRTSTPEYKGFRVTIASGAASPQYSCASGGTLPFSRGCYKAPFSVPAGSEFTEVRVPLSSFSDLWSPYTGDISTPCSQDHSACLISARLAHIQLLELWGEGVGGDVHLEVRSVSLELPSQKAVTTRPPAAFDSCPGPVQQNLRYGISGRTQPTVPVPVEANETLAEAVCCDKRVIPYAEPQFLFAAPDIALFSHLSKGVTTFYDSVCGLPVFRAPVNRTLADFEADTTNHGWPSFRPGEVVEENVITDKKSGQIHSSCGTYLGSWDPDTRGARWCIDLSCIAGNPGPAAANIVV